MLGSGLLGGGSAGLVVFFPDPGHNLPKLDAAVANSRIEVIQGGAAVALAHRIHEVLQDLVGELNIVPAEFPFQLGTAFHNIFFPALFFEPLANLVPGLAGLDNFQPVAAGAVAHFLGGEDFHNLAGLDPIVNGDNALIHLGSHHAVAHGAVDGIGKVNDRGAGGQADDLVLWG